MRFLIPSSLALASALVLAPAAVRGQAVVQPLPGTTDADRLADTMRRLAVSPNDLSALLDAGELSLRVGDLSGAASLFARADKVDPRNARVKAGMAAILVRAERPGEALRYLGEAESLGIAPARIAADRALAYDLIGEPERAQRDYRLALRNGADDETVRGYALSLGISGRREQALAVLEPLVRRSDRGAWRARAFVLAMTGDVPGATTIATTMMPAGMAQGLQPFFQRLPTLGAADRAFAVHFGEVRATPERLADARLTPALAPLAPEPQPTVVLAAAAPPSAADRGRRGRDRRGRDKTPPVVLAAVQPNTLPPVASSASPVRVQPVGRQPIAPTPTPTPSVPAAARPAAAAASASPGTPVAMPGFTTAGVAPAPGSGRPAASVPGLATVRTVPLPPSNAGAVTAPAPAAPFPAPAAPAAVAPSPMPSAPGVPAATTPAYAVASGTTLPPAAAPAQDSVLARIIANLSVPGAELVDAGPALVPAQVAPVSPTSPTAAARVEAVAREKTARDVAATRAVERIERAQATSEPAPSLSRTERRALAAKLVAGARLTTGEATSLLGSTRPDAATWTVSRAERRGVAAAVESGRVLTRSQQRVIAAAVDPRSSEPAGRRGVGDDPVQPTTRRERQALAAKISAGAPLTAGERDALGIGDVEAADRAPSRAERRRLASAVATGGTLTRDQRRGLAALASPAEAGDDRPAKAPTRRDRQALATKIGAGTPLGAADRTALGIADVEPAASSPTRAERRRLATLVESGASLTRAQQRDLAALGAQGDDRTAKGPTRRERQALAAKIGAGTPLGAADRTALGIADVDAADAAPSRAARRRLAGLVESGATLTRAQQRDLAALGADSKATSGPGRRGKGDDRDGARGEPERIWVQVATGANERDLGKAWDRVRDKAPDSFKGRSGYTAPLRATNRVVTGPFKTAAEAQAFVNGLARKGLSASTFTSDAGQKIAKLPSAR